MKKLPIIVVFVLLLTGWASAGTFQETIGGKVTAVGPAYLPYVGAIIQEQSVQASGNIVGSVSGGWNQGWQCLGTDGNVNDPNNYPAIELIDLEQGKVIQQVQVCGSTGHPNPNCWQPQSFDLLPQWYGPINAGDHIAIVTTHVGSNCIGGSPWQVCSSTSDGKNIIGTCGGGTIYITAKFQGAV